MKILVLLSLIFLPASDAWADTVTVENHVSSSVSTGGNSATGGQVIQGTSSSDIEIRTVIDGVIVEDTKIHEENSSGTPIVIEKKIESASSTTNIKVEINNSSSSTKQESKKVINKKEVKKINNLTATSSHEKTSLFKRIYEKFLSIFKFF